MGLRPERARSSIRISLSRMTTEEEVEEAARLIVSSVAQLRSMSKTWAAQHTLASA